MALRKDDPALAVLKAADELWAREHATPAADRRVLRAISGTPSRRWTMPALAFAAGVSLTFVAGLALVPRSEQTLPKSELLAVREAGFDVAAGRCDSRRSGQILSVSGQCELALDDLGVHMSTRGPVHLERAGEGVRLIDGVVDFTVARVQEGKPPVRVAVSHGVIEVVGTRFIVTQSGEHGFVDLVQGRIRFVEEGGFAKEIQPGLRYAWAPKDPTGSGSASQQTSVSPISRAAGTKVPPKTTSRTAHATESPKAPVSENEPQKNEPRLAPEPQRAQPPIDVLNEALERVAQLRAERRYAEATRILEKLDANKWPERERVILGFELGRLIEIQLGDRERACRYWQKLRAQLLESGHLGEIDRSIKRTCN